MAKLHYYEHSILAAAPQYVKEEYRKKNEDGAICGYVRKTTTDKEKVTCFYCLNEMRRQNIL